MTKPTTIKPSLKHTALYCRQLASIVGAGIPIAEALEILSRQAPTTTLKNASVTLSQKISNGESLASAMRSQGHTFPSLCCNLIAAGEQGGVLDETFDILNSHLERAITRRAQLQQILLYPIIITLVLLCTMTFLLFVVVPSFEELFAQSDTPLPILTQKIVMGSRIITTFWSDIVCAVTGITTSVLYLMWKYPLIKAKLEEIPYVIPKVSEYFISIRGAYYGDVLISLLRVGIPIYEALDILQGVAKSTPSKQRIALIQTALQEGASFAQGCEESGLFPPLMIEMIKTGEQTGTLDSMLSNALEHIHTEHEHAVTIAKKLLEPAIMVILGLVVGTLVIGLYLPLFDLGELSRL
jgi:type IV pilus assembly protein PilC